MIVKKVLTPLVVCVTAVAVLAWGGFTTLLTRTDELATSARRRDEVAGEVLSRSLRLTFAGDLMAHSVNYRTPNFEDIYADVRDVLRSDDLSFVNLEFPISRSRPYATYPRFSVHPEYVESAIAAGFDVFSVANNHTADWHRAGIAETLTYLRGAEAAHGIHHSGIRDEPGEAFRVTEIVHGEWAIGFLALSQFSNEWRSEAGVDLVHLLSYHSTRRSEAFLSWIEEIRPRYDLFILSYHGGEEYALAADRAKLRFFRRLILSGVDIVWGHHPHVLQPWELVERPDGSRGLVIASAGNFVSGQPWRLTEDQWSVPRAATGDSALYQVRVDPVRERVDISLSVLPIVHRRGSGGVTVRLLPSFALDDWAVFEGQRHRLSRAQLAAVGPHWFVD